MPSQVIGLIEIDKDAADFDRCSAIWEESRQTRFAFTARGQSLLIADPCVTEQIEADETALNAELDVEHARLLSRMRAR